MTLRRSRADTALPPMSRLAQGCRMSPSDSAVRVTQRVSLTDVEDLLSAPARAAVAYAGPDGPECVPVVVRRDGGIRIGVYQDAVDTLGAPDRVVLVIDDGAYWFELRAAVWRGTVAPERTGGRDRSDDDGLVWFRLDPLRFVAWDYGQLREDPA